MWVDAYIDEAARVNVVPGRGGDKAAELLINAAMIDRLIIVVFMLKSHFRATHTVTGSRGAESVPSFSDLSLVPF